MIVVGQVSVQLAVASRRGNMHRIRNRPAFVGHHVFLRRDNYNYTNYETCQHYCEACTHVFLQVSTMCQLSVRLRCFRAVTLSRPSRIVHGCGKSNWCRGAVGERLQGRLTTFFWTILASIDHDPAPTKSRKIDPNNMA